MTHRIIITMHYMELGGAERALLGLLEVLSEWDGEVDLFVYSHQGELMEYIPPGIHVLPENPVYASIEKPLVQIIRQGHWGMATARLWAKVANWWHNRHLRGHVASILDEVGRATVRVLPNLQGLGEYDLAISFLTPHYIVRDNVRAKRKIAWIHTDYSTISVNSRRELPVWASYDKIISISPEVTRAFLGVFPSLAPKIMEQENLLPIRLIQQQAVAFDAAAEMPGKIKLLSIGRFCEPKNFPGAVGMMAELCKLRDDVVWYIIGYGGGEEEIRTAIRHYGMEDKFIILGKRANPYPYIKACDLYIQPSLYEGKAVTVKEAQLLGKPVAITRYSTAASQVQDGIDGVILPLGNPKETAEAINQLLQNPALMDKIARQAKTQNLSQEATNILALIE